MIFLECVGSRASLSAEKATLAVAFFMVSGMRTTGVVIAQRLRSKNSPPLTIKIRQGRDYSS